MKLALNGGNPVRRKPFPGWPIWGEPERRALLRVLESGKWGSLHGTEVQAFETEFAAFQGAQYAIATTNGTTALELALRAARIEAGDEVLVPAYTFVATVTAVLCNGAVPVLVDIDPETCCIDPGRIEAAISPRTRAILPVHFAGRPADMDAINDIATRHNLVVIEDAAQAWGASWRGQGVGALGLLGGFSFQSSKNITAGEGGMILTNDAEAARLARSYSNCGRLPDGLWYAHYHLGTNARMTEFQGALLRAQLQRYPEWLKRRLQNAAYLDRALRELEVTAPLASDPRITGHAYHLYVFRYRKAALGGAPKPVFIDALRAEGIPASPGYSLPLYEQPLLREGAFGPFSRLLKESNRWRSGPLPGTERACYDEAVWLPQTVLLDEPDGMQCIVEALAKIYTNRDELRKHF